MIDLPEDISPEEMEVFLEDTDEQIRRLDEGIVRLEREPDNTELLQDLHRAAHTIKGSSAMLGYPLMAELGQAVATVLDRMRRGVLPVTGPATAELLHAMAYLKVLRDNLTSVDMTEVDIADSVITLRGIAAGSGEEHIDCPGATCAPEAISHMTDGRRT